MSGATFAQPATATSGLQNYNLERGVKRLFPGVLAGRAAWRALPGNRLRRGLLRSGRMKKGVDMADEHDAAQDEPDELTKMITTLRSSVAGIFANGGDDIEQKLEKSFGEFDEVLRGAVGAELDAVETEAGTFDPLFKGLGQVGRIASLAKLVSDQVELIKGGQDYKDQGRSNDACGDDVGAMLDSAQHCLELALRTAVNEHVGPLDDEDDLDSPPPGIVFVHVPDPNDPDNEDAGDVVKSDLPLELAKFATFPDLLESQKVELGGGLMLLGGMPEDDLAKLFGGGELAKGGFSPMTANGAPTDPAGTGDGSGMPDDGSGQPDDGSQDDPLDVLGRILAAGMIQLDHIRQLVDGDGASNMPDDGTGGDPTDDGSGDGSGADPTDPGTGGTAPGVPSGGSAPAKKPAFLKKFDGASDPRVEELLAKVGAMEGVIPAMAEMTKLMSQIGSRMAGAPPALMDLPALSKAEGLAGPDAVVDALAKMSPEDRQLAEIKAAHRSGR